LKSSAASSNNDDPRSTSSRSAFGESTTRTPICLERSLATVPPALVTSARIADFVPVAWNPLDVC
jgi:hypothetical protein